MKLYGELADWWPLLIDPDGYREAASEYARALEARATPSTVLELDSGGGSTACFLKERFQLTLVDLSPDMLEVSRRSNPDCAHFEGDMRSVRLGQTFDAVFVEDAIAYMKTPDDLLAAIRTASAHCRPGGVCLFAPDDFRETYEPGVQAGGRDLGERSLRYLEWNHQPQAASTLVDTDYAFLLRSKSESTRVVHDHHTCGLFESSLWLDLCESAGLEPELHRTQSAETAPRLILCRKRD